MRTVEPLADDRVRGVVDQNLVARTHQDGRAAVALQPQRDASLHERRLDILVLVVRAEVETGSQHSDTDVARIDVEGPLGILGHVHVDFAADEELPLPVETVGVKDIGPRIQPYVAPVGQRDAAGLPVGRVDLDPLRLLRDLPRREQIGADDERHEQHRRSLRQPPPQPLQAEFSAEEPSGQSTVTLIERPLRHGPLQRTLPEGVQLPAHGIVFPQGKFLLGVVFEKPFAQPFAHAGIAPVFEVTPEQILIYFFHRTSGF